MTPRAYTDRTGGLEPYGGRKQEKDVNKKQKKHVFIEGSCTPESTSTYPYIKAKLAKYNPVILPGKWNIRDAIPEREETHKRMRENTGDGGIFLGQILIVEEDTNYE